MTQNKNNRHPLPLPESADTIDKILDLNKNLDKKRRQPYIPLEKPFDSKLREVVKPMKLTTGGTSEYLPDPSAAAVLAEKPAPEVHYLDNHYDDTKDVDDVDIPGLYDKLPSEELKEQQLMWGDIGELAVVAAGNVVLGERRLQREQERAQEAIKSKASRDPFGRDINVAKITAQDRAFEARQRGL